MNGECLTAVRTHHHHPAYQVVSLFLLMEMEQANAWQPWTMKRVFSTCLFLTLLAWGVPRASQAKTTVVGGGIYEVTEGVNFRIDAFASGSFYFSWNDPDGTECNNIQDPILHLTIGEIYTFERFTTGNPLRLTNGQLPVEKVPSVAGPYYRRTTEDISVIDAASLTPLDDFTADPSAMDGTPSGDVVTLQVSASLAGTLYYTSLVPGNTDMTGLLIVKDPAAEALKRRLKKKLKNLRRALKTSQNKGKKRKARVNALKRRIEAITRRLKTR